MKKSQYYQEGYDVGRGWSQDTTNPYARLLGCYPWEQWNDGYTDGIIDRAEQDNADADEFYAMVDEQIVDDIGEIADYGKPKKDTTIRLW